jgi:hypothetical protein
LVLDLHIETEKQPSPSVNPASQLGSGILLLTAYSLSTKGLNTGFMSGKDSINYLDKPLLIDALIDSI